MQIYNKVIAFLQNI